MPNCATRAFTERAGGATDDGDAFSPGFFLVSLRLAALDARRAGLDRVRCGDLPSAAGKSAGCRRHRLALLGVVAPFEDVNSV